MNTSVVGFDLGNERCIVAVARQRGIDVVLNDESKRETPAIVCFGEGSAVFTNNIRNNILKRVLQSATCHSKSSQLMLFQSLKQCPPIPYRTDYITTIRSNPVYSITNDNILK